MLDLVLRIVIGHVPGASVLQARRFLSFSLSWHPRTSGSPAWSLYGRVCRAGPNPGPPAPPCSVSLCRPYPARARSRGEMCLCWFLYSEGDFHFLLSRAYIGLQSTRRSMGKQMAKFTELSYLLWLIMTTPPSCSLQW